MKKNYFTLCSKKRVAQTSLCQKCLSDGQCEIQTQSLKEAKRVVDRQDKIPVGIHSSPMPS